MRCPVIVTEQGLPMQFALHVWNVAPAPGSCVSETMVPTGKLVLHAPIPGAVPLSIQSMPAGALTM